MIEVKMKNMTGSEVIAAKLFPESGLVSYSSGEKEVFNHVMNLSAKGWEIYSEIKKAVEKVEVVEVKKGRNKK